MKHVILTALVVATTAQAEVGAGLKQLLDAADAQNIDRRISLEQREKAEADYRQAWTSLLPVLSASGTYTHNEKQVALALNPLKPDDKVYITPYDQFDAIVRVDIPLIDTTRWMRMLAANESQAGAVERELVMRDLVRKQVIASYYGYAASLQVLESAKKSVGVAEAQLKLMEIRSSAGAVTELELLRAKAELQRNKQTVVDAKSLVATTRRTLRTLSGTDVPEQVALPEPDLRPEAGFDELEQHVDELPAVKAAGHDREAAEKLSTAAKLALVPVVAGQFTERITNATGFAGQAGLYNYGLTISWRLDAPTIMGIDGQAHVERTAALAIERARLVAKDQVHSDWQRFNGALQKIEAAEAQVQAASRAAQVSRDRYAAGAATQVDVIQAERDMFLAELGQIQARTELATARLSLRISAGQPLE